MAELTLKLEIDPVTGKKTLVADFHSDEDALPHEHEEEHRALLRKLVEGAPVDGGGGLAVQREAEPAVATSDAAAEPPEAIEQKG